MANDVELKSQITVHSFVNPDYQNGNNDKRGEHIQNLRTEERIIKKLKDALNKK